MNRTGGTVPYSKNFVNYVRSRGGNLSTYRRTNTKSQRNHPNINKPLGSNVNNRRVLNKNTLNNTNYSQVSIMLKRCFPRLDLSGILSKNELNKFKWFLLYNTSNQIIGSIAARFDKFHSSVYLTHICSDESSRSVFKTIFKTVKQYYATQHHVYKFTLRVRRENTLAKGLYNREGFTSTNTNATFFNMKLNNTPKVLKEPSLTVSTLHLSNQPRAPYSEPLLQKLRDITFKRWIKLQDLWMDANPNSYKALLLGNLNISHFVMLNQYSTHPVMLVNRVGRLNNNQNVKKYGFNYYGVAGNVSHPTNHKPFSAVTLEYQSHDIFKSTSYSKTYDQLKTELLEKFDVIYNGFLTFARSRLITNSASTNVQILDAVSTYFDRGGQFTFYTHNNGLFQWLAMLDRAGHPFTGNCTVLEIFRVSIYERFTKSKKRTIEFVPQGRLKPLLNNPFGAVGEQRVEVCHYGMKMVGMTVNQQERSGFFPSNRYPGLEAYNVPNKSQQYQYQTMFNVLTTNVIFRAKRRAIRNAKNSPTILQNLQRLSTILETRMKVNPNSVTLHRHHQNPT